MIKKTLRWLGIVLVVLLVCLVAAFFWYRGRVLDSLPQLDGQITGAGLTADVSIDRDELGVPIIQAENLADAFFAQGFLHGQDRFFQMDLYRRISAGELSELMGPGRPLAHDEYQRALGYRRHAKAMADALEGETRQRFESYVAGVNAGLSSLNDVPFEYLALQGDPKAWLLEDTMLIAFFFFDALSYNEKYEEQLGPMKELLPPALYQFLTPDSTSFDSLLVRETKQIIQVIPGPNVLNLRDGKKRDRPGRDVVSTFDNFGVGSNNWVVAKKRSKNGKALLANDPHLRASIPGSWYRLQLKWGDHQVTGLSAPGAPGILIGENGRVAWGFTNGMADHEDLVVVEVNPDDKNLYRAPDGDRPFSVEFETIRIAGEADKQVEFKSTIWGPVIGVDWKDRPLALKSTATDPARHNLGIMKMMFATDLDEGITAASSWFGPSQNVLIADSSGDIGWVLSGYLVKRQGFDGKAPISWSDGKASWQGQVTRPVIRNPESGFLSTANNRLLDIDRARALSRMWVPGWRGRQIASLLAGEDKLDLQALAAMQLDTRNLQYDRLQELVKTEIDTQVSDDVAQAKRIVVNWDGYANLDSKGLHILKIFTERLREEVFAPLLLPCAKADKLFRYTWLLKDEPFFTLLRERPLHLLAPEHESWRSMINDVFKQVVDDIKLDIRFDLDTPWGEVRTNRYDHPIGHELRRMPYVGDWLNMPPSGLPGDANTIRAQASFIGASMRLVVSPGDPESGLFQMPGGQSGHFKSPHYRDQHSDWVHGRSRSFAPGKSKSKLTLVAQP